MGSVTVQTLMNFLTSNCKVETDPPLFPSAGWFSGPPVASSADPPCGLAAGKPRNRSDIPVLASLDSVQRCKRLRHIGLRLVSSSDNRKLRHAHSPTMSSASAKENTHPAIKGPSALRSILAGSTAGALEIGECASHETKKKEEEKKRREQEMKSKAIADTILSQPSPTPPNVRCRPPNPQALLTGRSDTCESRQDADTTQSQVGRRAEAAVAAIRQAVVCRVHDADHWQLGQGGDSYVARTHGGRKMRSQN